MGVAQPMHPVAELASEADKLAILGVMDISFESVQRSSSVRRGSDFWDWKYSISPYGRASVHVIKFDGRVAAAASLWPMIFHWQGSRLRALQACDTVVHPDFRRRGLFDALIKARKSRAAELNVDFIFNFPNANSLAGYQKAGWRLLGRVPWYVRVLKPVSLIRDRLDKGLSVAMDVPQHYRLREAIAETLVEAGIGDTRGLSIDRPAGFWRWRFCQRPNRQYGLICTENSCQSFAIFTLSKKSSGLVEMVVVDFIATRGTLSPLLGAIMSCAREVGAAFVAMMNPQAFSAAPFYRNGFMPVREKNLAFLPMNPELPPEIGEIGNWDFRAAIHDTI